MSRKVINLERKNYRSLKVIYGGYRNTTSRIIITFDATQKGIEAGEKILDSKLVCAKALALSSVNPDLNFEQIFFYEVSPFPPSFFDKENVLRTAKLKSNLMKTLKAESNASLSEQVIELIVNKIKTYRVKIINTINVTSKYSIPFKVTNKCIEDKIGWKKNQEEADTRKNSSYSR